ncbi:MAG: envelope stress response membrane protein PspC [Rhodospirillales bacterium]
MTRDAESNGRPSPSRLYRNPRDGVLFGVCAGIADYFGVRRWVVRVLWIGGLMMFPPPAILGYFILAVVLPRAPEHLYETKDAEHFWRDVRVDPGRKFSQLRHRFRELEHRLRAMEAYVTSEAYRVHRKINDL